MVYAAEATANSDGRRRFHLGRTWIPIWPIPIGAILVFVAKTLFRLRLPPEHTISCYHKMLERRLRESTRLDLALESVQHRRYRLRH